MPLTRTAGLVAMVRDLLAPVTVDDLAQVRANPWAPQHSETVLWWLHTVLDEEWEHHRLPVRDLDTILRRSSPTGQAAPPSSPDRAAGGC